MIKHLNKSTVHEYLLQKERLNESSNKSKNYKNMATIRNGRWLSQVILVGVYLVITCCNYNFCTVSIISTLLTGQYHELYSVEEVFSKEIYCFIMHRCEFFVILGILFYINYYLSLEFIF